MLPTLTVPTSGRAFKPVFSSNVLSKASEERPGTGVAEMERSHYVDYSYTDDKWGKQERGERES